MDDPKKSFPTKEELRSEIQKTEGWNTLFEDQKDAIYRVLEAEGFTDVFQKSFRSLSEVSEGP